MSKILVELFSGIGGFAKGLIDAGFDFDKHYFSEVDAHAIANYKYNFKNAEYIGSVKSVRNIIRTINRNPDDQLILTFGSPCQDFSLAGKGSGLKGDKSSLIKYAIFLIRWLKPDVFIWENVKGAYSANGGADYWAIIKAFTDIDGYRCEQQLLNTAWFLPQNRERIYIVGHLAGRSKPGVFPIKEDCQQNIELQGQYTNTLTARYYGAQATGGYIIERKLNEKSLTVHNLQPRSGDSNKGGTGPLRRMDGQAYCIDTGNAQAVEMDDAIRRFTEVECERLQGFPDNWTRFGNYSGTVRTVSKTQRYKMCGNAVSVPIVKTIGERLLKLFSSIR